MSKWFITDQSKVAYRQSMLSLKILKQLVSTISKTPAQHRIECINVAINTNLGLYEQELNGDAMSIYILLKKLIERCLKWDDVENILQALEDFQNYFLKFKCLDIVRIEILLRLVIHRGYITIDEIDELGKGVDFLTLRNIIHRLGAELLAIPPQNDLIVFNSKNE
jgi:hypothetical protein